MERLIAVDIGSGFTKVVFGDGPEKRMNFNSLVSLAPEKLGFQSEGAKVYRVGSNQYLVADDAHAFGDPTQYANPLTPEWAGSEPWKALLLAVFDRVGVGDGDVVTLITGLPQGFYLDQGDVLKAKLDGLTELDVNGVKKSFTLRCVVIPQASGALFDAAHKDEELLERTVGVIDIGTYTTGYAVLDNGKFVRHLSGGVEVGVHNLLDRLFEHLHQRYNHRADKTKLPEYVRKQQFVHRNEAIDLRSDLDRLAAETVRPIVDTVLRMWNGADHMAVFAGGGGAPLFYNAIRPSIEHVTLLDDPFWAVVHGMYLYGSNRPV